MRRATKRRGGEKSRRRYSVARTAGLTSAERISSSRAARSVTRNCIRQTDAQAITMHMPRSAVHTTTFVSVLRPTMGSSGRLSHVSNVSKTGGSTISRTAIAATKWTTWRYTRTSYHDGSRRGAIVIRVIPAAQDWRDADISVQIRSALCFLASILANHLSVGSHHSQAKMPGSGRHEPSAVP